MTTPTIPRISWPHVAALGIIVAGVVAVLVLAPDTTVGHILRIVAGVMGLSGAAGTASRGGVVKHEAPPPIRELPGVRTMPARKRSGHADLHTYGLIAVVAIGWALVRGIAHVAHWLGLGVLLLLVLVPGCATAAKVASVVEPVARVTCAIARKVTAACDVAFPETAADAACPAVAESETTGDEAP